MKKFMNFGVLALLGIALTFGVTSCSDDDPDYSNVTPPTVETAMAKISGMITTKSGSPIAGAEVTATLGSNTLKATTGENGEYKLEGLENGTYTMEASADGKQTMTGSVTVATGETSVWNTRLPNEATVVNVSQTEETTVEVVTETMENNEKAQVTTETIIPAAAVEEGEQIILMPVYSTNQTATRAATSKDLMLTGISISCSNPNAVLKAPIELNITLDSEVAEQVKTMKQVDGNWEDAVANVENGKVVFTVDEFATYSLFINTTLNETTTNEAISFDKAEYDNLYGASEMNVGTATYTYKQGAEINNYGSDPMSAYLVEMLAQQLSGSTVKTVNASYDINVKLPVGTALTLSGKQTVVNTSISAGSTTVSGKSYGNVSITANTYNRQHNGGTN